MTKKQRSIMQMCIGIMVLVLGCAIAALLLLDARPPAQQTEPTETTDTAPTAEPTLPPPEENPYGPNDFQYEGNYLKCVAGKSVLGIDISEFQTVTDWEAVKEAGIEFVMLRIGYRGYTSGAIAMDEEAKLYYEGAKAAGLKVGAYFFSQAINEEEAKEEARFVLSQIRQWQIDMSVAFDWEYVSSDARTANVSQQELTDITRAFCEEVKNSGYTPLIYFNQNQGYYMLDLAQLKDIDFWLAMYSDRMTYPYKLSMWQYTSNGYVPGIEEIVDINLWFPE